jgi:transposase
VCAISLGWRPDGSRIRRKVTGRTKTEVRDKLKKLQAEADAGLKTSASYTVAKAVDDWAAETLDGLADKTVRSHVDLLPPVTMLIGHVPLRDLTADRLLGDAALAALCGTSPVEASSGKTSKHRLNRGGQQRAVGIAHVRTISDPRTHAFVAKRTATGNSRREIMRMLQRYIARELYP